MADSRRTRDYQPDLNKEDHPQLPYLNDPGVTMQDMMGMGLSGAGNEALSNDHTRSDVEGSFERINNLGDQRRILEDGLEKIRAMPDYRGMTLGEMWQGAKEAGSAGMGLIGRGLDAITPSQGTIDNIAMRLQNAHAIGTGQTPLWMMQQQHMQNMQQGQQMMAYRRQQMADQLQQLQESKRQHDMQLLEKAMANPRASALLEQLGQDPNYSMAPQAAMLHKGMKDADYGSFQAYQQFIPQEIQDRFINGQLPQHELNGWLDMAREDAKVNAKANAKSMVLSRAMNKDPKARTPFEAQLVEEYQAAQELEGLKREEKQSLISKHNAETDNLLKNLENGGKNQQNFGHDREALSQEMFHVPYGQLPATQMAKVNSRLLNFQGQQQLNKSTAVQQAQLAVPDKASDAQREKTVGDLSTLDLLDKMGKNYSSDWVGPVRGRYGAATETFGGIGEDEAQFRADVTTLKNKVIKEITGAQMSEPEAARILGQVPDTINPDPVFKARLKATRDNLKIIAKRRREVMKETGVDTSTLPALPGGKSKAVQPDKIQSVLDEVFGGK